MKISNETLQAATRFSGLATERDDDLSATLMAIATHDLRQPLQVIMLERDILTRIVRDDALFTHLNRIDRAVVRISSILDGLLDTLRLADTSAADRKVGVPLRALFADVVADFTETARRRGIELRAIPPNEAVFSHPILLSGILRNLVHNAVEYTPRGGRVLIACRRRGRETRIEIRDNGVGIPKAELTNIFAPFRRGSASCSDGLGLGLFIVDRAAKFLGHRIEVRSELGRGSCFSVVANAALSCDRKSRMRGAAIGGSAAKAIW
jgi:signal transduction histidine kinase